jgi:hypothetical protein
VSASHGVEEIGDLEGDAFERGAADVRGAGVSRDADDGAARVGIPMRRAESGKGGHEEDSAAIRHGSRPANPPPARSGRVATHRAAIAPPRRR